MPPIPEPRLPPRPDRPWPRDPPVRLPRSDALPPRPAPSAEARRRPSAMRALIRSAAVGSTPMCRRRRRCRCRGRPRVGCRPTLMGRCRAAAAHVAREGREARDAAQVALAGHGRHRRHRHRPVERAVAAHALLTPHGGNVLFAVVGLRPPPPRTEWSAASPRLSTKSTRAGQLASASKSSSPPSSAPAGLAISNAAADKSLQKMRMRWAAIELGEARGELSNRARRLIWEEGQKSPDFHIVTQRNCTANL